MPYTQTVEQEFNRIRQQMINQGFSPADVDAARDSIGEQILWESVRHWKIQSCGKCNLGNICAHTRVAGVGPVYSPIALVGEGPGADEDTWSLPFVGASGHMLSIVLSKTEVDRNRIFITNVTRCYPNGAKVADEEVKACFPHLEFELGSMPRLQVIITMGNHSMHALRGDYGLRISQERGKWQTYNGIHMIHTWHPSYVLRQADTSPEAFKKAKSEFWTDFSQGIAKAKQLMPNYEWR